MELTRLFVSPPARGRGVGKLLLDAATNFIIDQHRRPALCVLDTQVAARALYENEGWEELGEFIGVSGRLNYVFLGPERKVSQDESPGLTKISTGPSRQLQFTPEYPMRNTAR